MASSAGGSQAEYVASSVRSLGMMADASPAEQPPLPATSFQRSAATASSFVLVWSSGYCAAQMWYTLVGDLPGIQQWAGYFPSVTINATVVGLVPHASLAMMWSACILMNIAFAIITWLLVTVQFKVHIDAWKENDSPPKSGWVVFVFKAFDVFVDGMTFVSSLFLYVAVLSTASHVGSDGQTTHQVTVGSMFLVTFVCFLLAPVFHFIGERLPKVCLRRSGRLSPQLNTKLEVVFDWFGGQWAWLMGYALWNNIMILLPSPYLNVYAVPGNWSWWMLIGIVIIIYYLFAALVLPSDDHVGPWWLPSRLRTLLTSGLNWWLGVGLFFTLRRAVEQFDDAIGRKPTVDVPGLTLYVIVITATVWVATIGLYHFKAVRDASAQERQRNNGGGGCARRSCSARMLNHSFKNFRLTFVYLVGTSWRAYCLGLTASYLEETIIWPVAILSTIFAGVSGSIVNFCDYRSAKYTTPMGEDNVAPKDQPCGGKSDFYPSDEHGQFCVCIACRPEAYLGTGCQSCQDAAEEEIMSKHPSPQHTDELGALGPSYPGESQRVTGLCTADQHRVGGRHRKSQDAQA